MKKVIIALLGVILVIGIAVTAFIIGYNHEGYKTVNFGDGEIAFSDLAESYKD